MPYRPTKKKYVLNKLYILRVYRIIQAILMSLIINMYYTVVYADIDKQIFIKPPIQDWLNAANILSEKVGIAIAPANGGELLINLNAEKSFNPASLMKLYTTYAALNILGSNYSWKTRLLGHTKILPNDSTWRGDIFIQGSGDPSLKLQDIWRLLRELRLYGITHIQGDWVFDRSIVKNNPAIDYLDSFDGNNTRPYNVQADGLLMNFHTTRLLLIPTVPNWTVIADPMPLGWIQDSIIRNISGICTDWQYDLSNDQNSVDRLNKYLHFTGKIPDSCGMQTLYRVIASDDSYTSGLISTIWKELGGTHSGGFRTDISPANSHVLAEIHSEPLSTVIRDINKRSNNVMAKMLYLNLSQTPPLNTVDSEKYVYNWLKQVNLYDSSIVFENGSGLSRTERSNAKALIQLLQHAYNSPVMPEFMSSLSIAGQDGTLTKRLHTINGLAHLKTGTLQDSIGLAGYVLSSSGKRYVVAGIINDIKIAAAQSVLDQLIIWLQNKG